MPTQLFEAGFRSEATVDSRDSLLISESFCDTIQGEGVYAGVPAVFLRLAGCTLDCLFCDSAEVWRTGKYVEYDRVLDIYEREGVTARLQRGHHLVITGGSPLKQQKSLVAFLQRFSQRTGFRPFIEMENECVLVPDDYLLETVSHWNNSPKLTNASGNSGKVTFFPKAIDCFNRPEVYGTVSWKFVISHEKDWQEINDNYILPGLIRKEEVLLMPCGASREELEHTRELTIGLAVENDVRFMDRLHIVTWDRKTGV